MSPLRKFKTEEIKRFLNAQTQILAALNERYIADLSHKINNLRYCQIA